MLTNTKRCPSREETFVLLPHRPLLFITLLFSQLAVIRYGNKSNYLNLYIHIYELLMKHSDPSTDNVNSGNTQVLIRRFSNEQCSKNPCLNGVRYQKLSVELCICIKKTQLYLGKVYSGQESFGTK